MAKKPTRLDSLERVEVVRVSQWRAWLKKHHTRTEGIWLVSYTKHVEDKYISWSAIVGEALCFGWIDGVARKLDHERSMLYLSPRKPRSVWSKVNKARIEELIAEERMAPAGLKAIEIAKANGSWTALDAVEAMIIPDDLAHALKLNRIAKKHFDAFPASVRKYTLTWISSARTEATRAKRIAETVSLATRNLRANQPRP